MVTLTVAPMVGTCHHALVGAASPRTSRRAHPAPRRALAGMRRAQASDCRRTCWSVLITTRRPVRR
eukprot:3548815-Prymnesium_polylepis.1